MLPTHLYATNTKRGTSVRAGTRDLSNTHQQMLVPSTTRLQDQGNAAIQMVCLTPNMFCSIGFKRELLLTNSSTKGKIDVTVKGVVSLPVLLYVGTDISAFPILPNQPN